LFIQQDFTPSHYSAQSVYPLVYPSASEQAMMRYPRSGKGRKWTILELKSIAANWRGDSLSDGDGLVGEVRVAADGSISVRFKYAFKWEGKLTWHQCGTWPGLGLDAIRGQRDAARLLLKTGVNPNDQKKADRIEAQASVEKVLAGEQQRLSEQLTFHDMFNRWVTDGVSRADGNKELRRTFEKDLLPVLGSVEIRRLDDKQLQDALRAVGRGRGCARTAARLLTEVGQMFRWAEKRKPWRALMVEGNPAALVDLRMVVPVGYAPVIRDRTLSPAEIRELRDIFERSRQTYEAAANRRAAERPVLPETQIAMWLCMSTACRIGELLKARWENVDLAAKRWFVPAEDTKTKTAWDVFLSDFAVRQFQALKLLTGGGAWCFPARNGQLSLDVKTVSKQIGDRQMRFKARRPLKGRRNDNSLVLADGAFGEWTPHDLRRSAATMMQRLGVSPDVIDRCQNHVMQGSRIRRHYLHYDFEAEKREAWQKLGVELQRILAAPQPPGTRRGRLLVEAAVG
jgi:integrase